MRGKKIDEINIIKSFEVMMIEMDDKMKGKEKSIEVIEEI